MKCFFIIGSLIVCSAAFANRVDSVRTDKDVETFIHQLFIQKYPYSYDNKYYSFSIKKPDSVYSDIQCDSLIKTWDLKSWQKIDFNQDTHTDLFTIIYIKNIHEAGAGLHICVAIDKGNNTFGLQEISGYHLKCYAAMPIVIKDEPFLLYRHHKMEDSLVTLSNGDIDINNSYYYDVAKTDTLIYKFGGFIELTKKTTSSAIKSIFYESSGCLGRCPVFKLNIFNDGSAFFIGEMFTSKTGNFRATIRSEDLNQIWGLLSYININNLLNSYSINATCNPSANLKIFYADGSVKEIDDYGQEGTLGLIRLYELLLSLCDSQNWE